MSILYYATEHVPVAEFCRIIENNAAHEEICFARADSQGWKTFGFHSRAYKIDKIVEEWNSRYPLAPLTLAERETTLGTWVKQDINIISLGTRGWKEEIFALRKAYYFPFLVFRMLHAYEMAGSQPKNLDELFDSGFNFSTHNIAKPELKKETFFVFDYLFSSAEYTPGLIKELNQVLKGQRQSQNIAGLYGHLKGEENEYKDEDYW